MGIPTVSLVRKILTSAKKWEEWMNIKFVNTKNVNESDIRISFTKKIGTWSYVGI